MNIYMLLSLAIISSCCKCIVLSLEIPILQSGKYEQVKIKATSPITEISVCLWAKSKSLERTGSLFVMENALGAEFGLVQDKNSQEKFKLFLIVKNKTSKSVAVRIDDTRWHHIFVTWSSFNGAWSLYLDGRYNGGGKELQTGYKIKDSALTIGSNLQTGKYSKFAGEVSDLYAWNKKLHFADIHQLKNCRKNVRKYVHQKQSLNENLLVAINPLVTNDTCNKDVTVICKPTEIIISIHNSMFDKHDLDWNDFHLNDHSCKPANSGPKPDKSSVFVISDLQACGSKREISQDDIVYTNVISNFPLQPINHVEQNMVSMGIECKFPIKIDVTMDAKIGRRDENLIDKIVLKNPVTNKYDIEAIGAIYEDAAFSKIASGNRKNQFGNHQSIFMGFVSRNMSSLANTGANLVTDSCKIIYSDGSEQFMMKSGCSSFEDIFGIFENGISSQNRFVMNNKLFSSGQSAHVTCAVYSCSGNDCAPKCRKDFSKRQKRSTEIKRGKMNFLTFGPITLKTTASDYIRKDGGPTLIVALPVLLSIIILLLSLVIIWLFFHRHKHFTKYDNGEAVKVTRSKFKLANSLAKDLFCTKTKSYDVTAIS